jgi:hypothetical protein
MAARVGNPSDIKRAAGEIMSSNPLGGVCGLVCPDRFCMAACSRKKFDGSINIPKVQATLVEMAKRLGGIPKFETPAPNGKTIAVIGGGPAGLGVASVLGQLGYAVDIYESRETLGGMMNLIPDQRLDKKVVQSDDGLPGPGGENRPVLHDRHQIWVWHTPRPGVGDSLPDAGARHQKHERADRHRTAASHHRFHEAFAGQKNLIVQV